MVTEDKINRAIANLQVSSEITVSEVRQAFLDSGESEEDTYFAIMAAEVAMRLDERDWLSGETEAMPNYGRKC